MNHYDGPIRNTEQQLVHIYYTLFCRCGALLRLSPATATCAIIQHRLDFLHPILLCRITYGAPLEMLYPGIRYLLFSFFFLQGIFMDKVPLKYIKKSLGVLYVYGNDCVLQSHQEKFCPSMMTDFLWYKKK
jgi:hypothetical protein